MIADSKIASRKVLLRNSKGQYEVFPAIIEIDNAYIKKVTLLEETHYLQKISTEKELCVQNKVPFKDYGERLISPSFINAHTHIPMNFFKPILEMEKKAKNLVEDVFFKSEKIIKNEDIYAFAKIGAYENLLNGCGLIWDHYYAGLDIAKACHEVGLAAVVAPTIQDIFGPGAHRSEEAFEDTHTIQNHAEFKKKGVFAALGPHATDTVSSTLWERIREHSVSWNLPVHVHVAQHPMEAARIKEREGCSPIEYLQRLGILGDTPHNVLVHCIHTSAKDLRLIPKHTNTLIFCPFSQIIFDRPADITLWQAASKEWAVATDTVASNDSMNVQKELRFCASFPNLKKAFHKKESTLTSPLQDGIFFDSDFLLDKVFYTPGKMHPQFKAGVIEEKALANFIVWDINHPSFWPPFRLQRSLCMGDTTGAIYNMCVAGNWLGTDGNFYNNILQSKEYQESIKEANKRLQYLLQRLHP